ncbi:unnamed protein product [Psylliodes chrysocephalus]|uniref:SAP domain-containing protein n=1 Tax=Psylliodes chrysocephalus TaxID=3402493 RepID=A0A9P0CIT2_9CUCU|nr:unnamed protein product [Psylliodes chrysocephala]
MENIITIFDLKTLELKQLLEIRGLDKTGIKLTLLNRLKEAMEKEGKFPEQYDCRIELNVEEKETTPATEEVETVVKEVLSAETHTKMEMNDQLIMLLDYMKGMKEEQRRMGTKIEEEQRRMGTKIEEEQRRMGTKIEEEQKRMGTKIEEMGTKIEKKKKTR